MEHTSVMYRYVHNLQGDIVAILDAAGNPVVEYKYDAWGKSIDVADSGIGAINPFRYRGYIYDEEAGLCYLRSRYYCPEWERFINADIVNESFVYSRVDNCYSYCNCCPTMYIDDDGFVGKVFELGKGWYFRIDSPSAGDEVQRHIHVWKKGGSEFSQNADGSAHDGLEGTPPKWIREKLKQLNKWEWKTNGPSASVAPSPGKPPKVTPAPTPIPTLSPSPSSPPPAYAPVAVPATTSSAQRNTKGVSASSSDIEWGVVGVAIIGVLYWGGKIIMAPHTFGLSLAMP